MSLVNLRLLQRLVFLQQTVSLEARWCFPALLRSQQNGAFGTTSRWTFWKQLVYQRLSTPQYATSCVASPARDEAPISHESPTPGNQDYQPLQTLVELVKRGVSSVEGGLDLDTTCNIEQLQQGLAQALPACHMSDLEKFAEVTLKSGWTHSPAVMEAFHRRLEQQILHTRQADSPALALALQDAELLGQMEEGALRTLLQQASQSSTCNYISHCRPSVLLRSVTTFRELQVPLDPPCQAVLQQAVMDALPSLSLLQLTEAFLALKGWKMKEVFIRSDLLEHVQARPPSEQEEIIKQKHLKHVVGVLSMCGVLRHYEEGFCTAACDLLTNALQQDPKALTLTEAVATVQALAQQGHYYEPLVKNISRSIEIQLPKLNFFFRLVEKLTFSYAFLGHFSPRVTRVVLDHVLTFLEETNKETLTQLMWYLGSLNYDMVDPKVLEQLSDRSLVLASRPSYSKAAPGLLITLMWFWAVCNYQQRDRWLAAVKAFNRAIRAVGGDPSRLNIQRHTYIRAIHVQTYLSAVLPDQELSPAFLEHAQAITQDRPKYTISSLQKDVFDVLTAMELHPVQEVESKNGGQHIDILFNWQGKPVAVEVDGFSHTSINPPYRMLGPARLRNLMLEFQGYQVLTIPWHEYPWGRPVLWKVIYIVGKLRDLR